jgi:O-succinylbenzoate synthase
LVPVTELRALELRTLDLSLAAGVDTAAGSHLRRPLLLARVVTDVGEGWGESGALDEGTAVDPPLREVAAAAERLGESLLASGSDLPPPDIHDAAGRMARALLEMALLDATLAAAGRSLHDHLGGVRNLVPVGGVVGMPPRRDVGALLDGVDAVLRRGAQRVRLKIGPTWDTEPVRAVRERYPDLMVQADANGAYRLDSEGDDGVAALQRLDAFGLTCLEQPMDAVDLGAHARLASILSTPIALDESLWSGARVTEALERGAMAVACLKPARLGGLDATAAAQARCTDAGCRVFVGGFFESGLGRSANLALASRSGFDLPGDLTAPVDYLSAQPFAYPAPHGGSVSVPDGAGVGSAIDREVVERHTVWHRWLGGRAT